MARNSDEVALLKATATKGADSPSELAERIGSARTYTLLSFALTVAAARRFPEGDSAEVQGYVADLRQRFPDSDILKPAVAEALLRAVLGESDQLEGVDPADAGALLFFLSHVMLTDMELSQQQLDEVIDAVLDLAAPQE